MYNKASLVRLFSRSFEDRAKKRSSDMKYVGTSKEGGIANDDGS